MPKPIPEGYHSVTPYLIVDDANAAIKFYERAFGAKEKFRLPMGNRVGHAELEIGDSVVMLADEFPVADQRAAEILGAASIRRCSSQRTGAARAFCPECDVELGRRRASLVCFHECSANFSASHCRRRRTGARAGCSIDAVAHEAHDSAGAPDEGTI